MLFVYITLYSYQILMKTEFSLQIYKKYSVSKFNENSSSGIRVLCGQTDRLDEANSSFSQFSERAKKTIDVCSEVHKTRKNTLCLCLCVWRSWNFWMLNVAVCEVIK